MFHRKRHILKIPLIIAYTGCDSLLKARKYSDRWPKALKERITNGTAKAIHIAFKEKAIMAAISQFTVHSQGDDELNTSLGVYSEENYISWGYLEE